MMWLLNVKSKYSLKILYTRYKKIIILYILFSILNNNNSHKLITLTFVCDGLYIMVIIKLEFKILAVWSIEILFSKIWR